MAVERDPAGTVYPLDAIFDPATSSLYYDDPQQWQTQSIDLLMKLYQGRFKRDPTSAEIAKALSAFASGRSIGSMWLDNPASSPETPAPAAPVMAAARTAASDAALRQRRRASVGNAGRVTTGTPTVLQAQIGSTGAPRTLIGS